MLRSGLLLVIFLAAGTTPVAAQSDVCSTYLGANGAPSEVAEILELDPTGGVVICAPNPPEKRYGLLSTVLRGPLGSCQYRNRSVFNHVRRNRRADWRFEPPPSEAGITWSYQYMALPADKCPPQGDAKYVGVNGLSEDVFLRIVRAWNRITDSPSALDHALRGDARRTSDPLRSWYSASASGSRAPHSIRFMSGISPIYRLSFDPTTTPLFGSLVVDGNFEQGEFVIYSVGIGVH
jgi:hypothetical protein